ncbi:hypothetical protein AVEN_85697-1 [Araneus ventricosus]|uniref:Regulatory protein zeste n=1 Tax=Araneus ventricosus TaxID=182803 RepID=A0A4Y2SWA7_ARAVE|nr:hypothetical protein AVEN_85697-1 [Araneus ventricosus]
MALPPGKLYFTLFEKELILVLVKPHLEVIENKETNGVTSAEKAKAFCEITKQFNATDGVNQRTAKQIRQCYLNLKKKLRQKSTCLRQELRKTGGGEVAKEVELSTLERRFLEEPILTLPLSTPYDSDTSQMEILKSQDKSNADDPFVRPLTPSQNASAEASELDTSSMNFLDSSLEVPESDYEKLVLETPEPSSVSEASGVKTPKQRSLRDTLMMFRKNTKKQAAPSAAARAAACIEAEHKQSIKYMQKEEERKEKQAEADRKEQELRMDLLREKIKLTKTKTLMHEKLLELMNKNPSSLSFLKNVLSDDC